ncbi:MAG: hypothetical protein WBW37_04415, partial [Methyloceanibacter sp.]
MGITTSAQAALAQPPEAPLSVEHLLAKLTHSVPGSYATPWCALHDTSRGALCDLAGQFNLRHSQPPEHDGRDVGNCDHHCGDHGLIEKSDG